MLSKNMYEEQLIKAGLTQKQAKLYLACLELGLSNAPKIAKKAGLKRTTAYGVLDELASQGLVSVVKKGRIKFFRAQEPSALIKLIKQKELALAEILPDLDNLFIKYQISPRLEFFEGSEGVKRIYEDSLKCKSKKIYQVVKVKDFINFPSREFSKRYIKERVKRNIWAYALHPQTGDIYNELYGRQDTKLKRHVRYLPPIMFHPSMIMIYDYKVVMISTKREGFGFIIESKEFSNTMKALFEFMWRIGAKDYDNKGIYK